MSPFASRTVLEHGGRGAGAAILVTLAVSLLSQTGVLRDAAALACFATAAALLRGCPMCWFIGLIETVSSSFRKGHMS